MVIADIEAAASQLRQLIDSASNVVAFTGAGLSTESGVPDYRSKNSPWTRYTPIPFDLFVADPAQRVEAWRRKFAMDDLYADARPSRGHSALSQLVQAGQLAAIITQNIDDLHQRSGVGPDHLIELHGNGTYATCLTCAQRYELPPIRRAFEDTGEAPRCVWCGGIVKSATISFGQALPTSVLKAAQAATLACDLFIAIGSSLVVYPAAALPVLAQRHGAKLVILNGEATPLDRSADMVLRGDIGTVLDSATRDP
ncbi:Sir2 family NAD-dependent protein deacetylase [Beijerinckia sp. L45]|uniref:SIR2 family NAD-dependent protein deacylase n=1 Tax=Beijerinckia sp. L45 TaxID=1641855 RepID=UPI00131BCB79|nr:Sir2 family NAD-dependent protein deacetylase [Beijerinckia sp. L45]